MVADHGVNFTDKFGIQVQVMSISESGVTYLKTLADSEAMAQGINDYTRDELLTPSAAVLAGRLAASV